MMTNGEDVRAIELISNHPRCAHNGGRPTAIQNEIGRMAWPVEGPNTVPERLKGAPGPQNVVSGYCRPRTGSLPGKYGGLVFPCLPAAFAGEAGLGGAPYFLLHTLNTCKVWVFMPFPGESSYYSLNMEAFCSKEKGTSASFGSRRLIKEWNSKWL